MAKATMTESATPIATIKDAYGGSVAIVGVVRPATPIGAASRVRGRIGDRVTSCVASSTLARPVRIVVIGSDGLESLAAVFG